MLVKLTKLVLGESAPYVITTHTAKFTADQTRALAEKLEDGDSKLEQLASRGLKGAARVADVVHENQLARYKIQRQLDAHTITGQLRHVIIDASFSVAGIRSNTERQAIANDEAELAQMHQEADTAEKTGDGPRAFRLFGDAAERSYLPAINRLAFCYLDGVGTTPDEPYAVQLFEHAARDPRTGLSAAQAHARTSAQYNLGQCLDSGRGITANAVKAAEWMLRAAGAGHAGAQFFAGSYLIRGQGIARNHEEGLRLMRRSADQGYALAAEFLAELEGAREPQTGFTEYPEGSAEWAWQELGLQPGATWEQVRLTHRRLIAALHPDHSHYDPEEAEKEATRLNVARDVLRKLINGRDP